MAEAQPGEQPEILRVPWQNEGPKRFVLGPETWEELDRLLAQASVAGAEQAVLDIAELFERLSPQDAVEGREGMLTVYDHEDTYAGCIGRETWELLLAEGEGEKAKATRRRLLRDLTRLSQQVKGGYR